MGDKWLSKEEIGKTTGKFKATFHFQGPESSHDYIMERFAGIKPKTTDYKNHVLNIEDETYQVVVPENYDPTKKCGLFVFVKPTNGGGCPRAFIKSLADHNILFVGANQSGNKEKVTQRRVPLAIAAVFNMKLRYNIDDSRVYISGFSGGARVASHVAIAYPDMFSGALYCCGCNPQAMPADEKLANLIKNKNRYVFQTCENDFNNQNTRDMLQSYKNMGVINTYFFEVPKLKHVGPTAEYAEKAIKYLEGKK